MTEEQEKAFKQAYSDCSSQANEGYVPDRGGFKAGFLAGVRYKETEFKGLEEQWALQWTDEAAANAAGFNEAFEKFRPEIERLTKENAKLQEALKLIADQNINAWCRTIACENGKLGGRPKKTQ